VNSPLSMHEVVLDLLTSASPLSPALGSISLGANLPQFTSPVVDLTGIMLVNGRDLRAGLTRRNGPSTRSTRIHPSCLVGPMQCY